MRRASRLYAVLLLVIAVASTAVAVYQYYSFREEKLRLLEEFRSSTSFNLLRVNGEVDLLLYLLERNATVDEIRLILDSIISNSHVLSETYSLLHRHTGDERLWKVHLSFANLYSFALDVVNDPPSSIIVRLREKAGTLSELSNLLRSIRQKYHNDLRLAPEEDIERLVSLTEELLE